MAISDAELLYGDAQDGTVATATPEISDNVYDSSPLFTGNGGVDLGHGTPLYGTISVDTSFDSTGDAAFLQIEFVSSAAEALTTPTVHWDSGAIAELDLAAGDVINFVLPPGSNTPGSPYLRYTGFILTASGENITVGELTMRVSLAPSVLQKAGDFASALNIVTPTA